ncbi:hypothetical protein NDU88_007706 [Pleurodeles waltl]|uniref:Uncharacterized protein n=1 Tax=Pleurodeles waltl TaxID=8319 RepID=A0AAV7VV62_PLEWA|nr:hypothetical protein NDU88_007706 [Pleurodeles waltl]
METSLAFQYHGDVARERLSVDRRESESVASDGEVVFRAWFQKKRELDCGALFGLEGFKMCRPYVGLWNCPAADTRITGGLRAGRDGNKLMP